MFLYPTAKKHITKSRQGLSKNFFSVKRPLLKQAEEKSSLQNILTSQCSLGTASSLMNFFTGLSKKRKDFRQSELFSLKVVLTSGFILVKEK